MGQKQKEKRKKKKMKNILKRVRHEDQRNEAVRKTFLGKKEFTILFQFQK